MNAAGSRHSSSWHWGSWSYPGQRIESLTPAQALREYQRIAVRDHRIEQAAAERKAG